jgi:hypothetical protein
MCYAKLFHDPEQRNLKSSPNTFLLIKTKFLSLVFVTVHSTLCKGGKVVLHLLSEVSLLYFLRMQ